jgi:hypothetical protein
MQGLKSKAMGGTSHFYPRFEKKSIPLSLEGSAEGSAGFLI